MSAMQQTPCNINDDLVVKRIDEEKECKNISPKLLFPDQKAIASPTDVMNIDDIEVKQSSKSNDKEEVKTTSKVDFQTNIKKALDKYQIRMRMFFDPAKIKSFISMEDLEKEHSISKNQALDVFKHESKFNDDNDIGTDELNMRIEELYSMYKSFSDDKKRQQRSYETAKKYEKRVLKSYKEGMEHLFKNLVSGLSQEELNSYHSNLMNEVLKFLDDPQDVGSNSRECDENLKLELKQQIQERWEIYNKWYKEFKAKEEERWARKIEQKVKEEKNIKAKDIMNKAVSRYKISIEKNISDISIDTEKVSECHRKLLSRAKDVLEREIEDESIIDTYRKELFLQIENHYVYISAITNERIVRENEKRALNQYLSSMDKIVLSKGPYKPLSLKEMNDHHDKVMVKINKYYNGAKEYGDIVQNSKRDLMVQINDHFKRYIALNEERRHIKKMSMKGNQQKSELNIQEFKQSILEFNIRKLNIRGLNKQLVIGSALVFILTAIIYQVRINASSTFKVQKAIDYSMDRYIKGMNKIVPESTNVNKVKLQSTHEDLYMDVLDLFDNLAVGLGASKSKIQNSRGSLISSILKTYESYENLNNEKAKAIEEENNKGGVGNDNNGWIAVTKIAFKRENLTTFAGSAVIFATSLALFFPFYEQE